MDHWKRLVSIIAVLIISGLACNIPSRSTQPAPTVQTTKPSSSLQPGGLVRTDAGVDIGATEQAVEQPLDVFAETISSADISTALPQRWEQVGDYYRVGADRTMILPAEQHFVIGMPVAQEIGTDHLAIAVLVPKEYVFGHSEGYEPVDTWSVADGFYDANTGQLYGVLGFLPQEGMVVTIVRNSAFHTKEANNTGSSTRGSGGLAQLQASRGFKAVCSSNFDWEDVPESCTDAVKADVESEFKRNYAEFTSAGFLPPNLYHEPDTIIADGVQTTTVIPGPYQITLHPCSKHKKSNGMYLGGKKKIWVCFNKDGITSGEKNTITHEYFHATQWQYSGVLEDGSNYDGWVLEGTARAAQSSLDTWEKTGGVRDIDLPLGKKRGQYQAQDFWIYLGMREGKDLTYLIPFFEEGSETEDVDAVIQRDYPHLNSLSEVYWDWVKNQAFEKRIDFDGVLGAQCELTRIPAGYRALNINDRPPDGAPAKITYALAPPANEAVSLEPLESVVYELEFNRPASSGDEWVEIKSFQGAVRSKIYKAATTTSAACLNEPDSSRVEPSSFPGTETFYLLIANTSTINSANVTIEFGPRQAEGLTILSPGEGSSFQEGDDINFIAVASDPPDNPGGDLRIVWTYLRYDGVPVTIDQTGNGETATFSGLCDGTYDVTAEALDPNTGVYASDSVTIEVMDLGGYDTPDPPDHCRPTIEIIEPRNEYPETMRLPGNLSEVTLQAKITDDHPETETPLYPIVWRNTYSRDNVGTGLSTSFEVEPDRNYNITVSYGEAWDRIKFIVRSTLSPPDTTIISPESNTLFQDNLSSSVSGVFRGEAEDNEDGAISGNQLFWSWTEEGKDDWHTAGTGEEVTISFRAYCDEVQYRVRLKAVDSDGDEGYDEILIRVRGPEC